MIKYVWVFCDFQVNDSYKSCISLKAIRHNKSWDTVRRTEGARDPNESEDAFREAEARVI